MYFTFMREQSEWLGLLVLVSVQLVVVLLVDVLMVGLGFSSLPEVRW